MSGTIFSICSTSAISALSAVPRIDAELAAPKGWRKGCKNKKKKTGFGEIQAKGNEPARFCLYKLFICEQSDCVEEPGGYSKLQVDRLDSQGDLE